MHDSDLHTPYMQRCFDLARRGAGRVSPNPMVGAVIVHQNRILSEGYHRSYGGAHAERDAISRVRAEDRSLLPDSTLYVSLEPCCHFGKTPPCTDLIFTSGFKTVVISSRDPNPLVSSKGVAQLRTHGIQVHEDVCKDAGNRLIRYFNTSMTKSRPHVILKIVQSSDGYIGKHNEQIWLSNDYERVMVHKLRSEIDAIMVGTNTAVVDNPELTTRHYPGRSPMRIIVDRTGRIPAGYSLLDGSVPTLMFSENPEKSAKDELKYKVISMTFDDQVLVKIMRHLHKRKVQSILVEGGAALIKDFLRLGLWDEALVVRTPKELKSGVKAPLIDGRLKWRYLMAEDEILAIVPDR